MIEGKSFDEFTKEKLRRLKKSLESFDYVCIEIIATPALENAIKEKQWFFDTVIASTFFEIIGLKLLRKNSRVR